MITDHKAKSEHKSNLALAIVHSNNSRIFQYILSIKGNDQYPTPIFYNYKQASTDSDKAQLFNEYCYSVYTSSKQQINDCERTASPDTLQDITISESEVFKILTSLDSNKACGIDNISPIIFKNCAAPLLQVVCHLFSTSLRCNSIPQEWHTHCVIPIYKTADKSSVSNYRPISLLCTLSKVL